MGVLDMLWRLHQRRSFYARWFCIDKPARIANGAGADGLFEHERSQADRERLPFAHTCEPEFHRAIHAEKKR